MTIKIPLYTYILQPHLEHSVQYISFHIQAGIAEQVVFKESGKWRGVWKKPLTFRETEKSRVW